MRDKGRTSGGVDLLEAGMPAAPRRGDLPERRQRGRRSGRRSSGARGRRAGDHDRATAAFVGIDRGASRLARRPGELTAVIGLSGLFISVSSKFAGVLTLPAWSQGAVAGASGALLALGIVQRRRPPEREIVHATLPTDLPTLTGQIASVLARLRLEHGLAYRSNTWVSDVIPRTGVPVDDQALIRDILAVCALDAGGVRADTSALLAAHSRERLILAAMALLDGLQRVLSTCNGPSATSLPSSDPTRWPA